LFGAQRRQTMGWSTALPITVRSPAARGREHEWSERDQPGRSVPEEK